MPSSTRGTSVPSDPMPRRVRPPDQSGEGAGEERAKARLPDELMSQFDAIERTLRARREAERERGTGAGAGSGGGTRGKGRKAGQEERGARGQVWHRWRWRVAVAVAVAWQWWGEGLGRWGASGGVG